jgi:SCF-associated factor 1
MSRGFGPIADLQVGGWSTSFLAASGKLYCIGVLDGQSMNLGSAISDAIVQLGFPETDIHKSPEHKAINQFSSGRSTVLGLADDQSIWLWRQTGAVGIEIRFPALQATPSKFKSRDDDLGVRTGEDIDDDSIKSKEAEMEADNYRPPNTTRVISGWQTLSAYIRGHGILIFPIRSRVDENQIATPPFAIVDESTYFRPPKPRGGNYLLSRRQEKGDEPGEVTSHILLENFVVFTTDNGNVFASTYPQFHPDQPGRIQSPPTFQIPELNEAVEVQGSFRSFGVFKKSGEVIVLDQNFLESCALRERTAEVRIPAIKLIPALQNSGVIQLAFGDYHYHALHTDGSITSYGNEPDKCGALGLSQVRGVVSIEDLSLSGQLLPHGYVRGRRVWFHHAQWEFEEAHANNPRFSPGGWQPRDEETALQQWMHIGEFGEWVEQKGSNWHKWSEVKEVDEDGLGPFFAISIAAGGWSSGALVLVNDKVVDKIQDIYERDRMELNRPVNILLSDGSDWNWEARGHRVDWPSPPPEFKFRATRDRSKSVYGFSRFEEINDP